MEQILSFKSWPIFKEVTILGSKQFKLINMTVFAEKRQGAFIGAWASIRINIQSTLIISTSVISNNRLSRTENLIPVLT